MISIPALRRDALTSHHVSIALFAVIFTFTACKNTGDVPFTEKDNGSIQPVTVPLQLSVEKTIVWDTSYKGKVSPLTKKLDIDALPSAPLDSTGFKLLKGSPTETKVDLGQLPSVPLNFGKLPVTTFKFITSILPPPALVKTMPLDLKKDSRMSVYQLGISQGLSAKFVTSLLKDRNGLLWIGAAEGIFTYDGEYTRLIVPPPFVLAPLALAEDNNGNIWFTDVDRVGMVDVRKGMLNISEQFGTIQNNLSRIVKDEEGRLWVSKTSDKALHIIDPNTLSFRSIDTISGLRILDGDQIDICEDQHHNMWLATNRAGFNIINLKEGNIKYFDKKNGLAMDTVWSVTKDDQDNIWTATRQGGISKIDVKHGVVSYYPPQMGFQSVFSPTLTYDREGKLWIGRGSGFEIFDVINNTLRFNESSYTTAFLEDEQQRIWVASLGDGLSVIEQGGQTTRPYNAQIISLIEDGSKNVWVATRKGLGIMNFQKNVIHYLDKAHGLSDDFVQNYNITNGNVIVSTDGGYNIVDPVKKTIQITSKKQGLLSDTIYGVLRDHSGNSWIVGPNAGLSFLDSAYGTLKHLDKKGGLSDNNIIDIKQDRFGKIWVATSFNGVDIIDPGKGTVNYLNNLPGLNDTCNRTLLEDAQGRMWIGTDKGVYVADLQKKLITNISAKEGLAGTKVVSLLKYKGLILVGTLEQVNLITPPEVSNAGWKVAPLKMSEKLIREITNSWQTDGVTSDGKYLFGNADLTVINGIEPETDSAATMISGMTIMTKPANFIMKTTAKQKDSTGTGNSASTKESGPSLSGYATDYNYSWDSVTGPYNLPVNLKLPHDQNYLQFQFAQNHWGRSGKTFYSYILQGIDKNWSVPDTKTNTENYLNLPPGAYTFQVRSRSVNGKWTEPASLQFTITPPWYATWWAYTLYALAGIILLRAYIVFRSRRLKRENRLLEEKVALRTSQLQKSIEELRATQAQLIQQEKMASLGELTAGIAHEIQNPLNFVNNFSEVNLELIEDLKTEGGKINGERNPAMQAEILNDIKQNTAKIIHHGKRADSIVKSMLQHTRVSTGQKELTDINALCDEYLRLSYHGLRAKDKSFNAAIKTNFDPASPQIKLVSQDVSRVLLNLFNNAFHAVRERSTIENKTYQPLVMVTTKKTTSIASGANGSHANADTLLITVTDNGTGIPQNIIDKIFQPFFTTKPTGQGTGLGLSLSYDIIKAHGGEIKVESKQGEGTSFIIQLPVV